VTGRDALAGVERSELDFVARPGLVIDRELLVEHGDVGRGADLPNHFGFV